MYNQPSQNQPTKWEAKPLLPITYYLLPNKAMSLMEVLASMFVICIGLLGVLAVIPYGAFQVAKAKNAENTSWMLANAEYDLKAAGMAKPENWQIVTKTPSGGSDTISTVSVAANGGPTIYSYQKTEPTSDSSDHHQLNCSRYFMIDPFVNTAITTSSHIYRIGTNFNGTLGNSGIWRERMTGQDDLVYTTHADKRTDFSGQNNKVLSSGQYTWFFMFRPIHESTYIPAAATGWLTKVPCDDVEDTANVDILACFNRVPGDERLALSDINPPAGTPSDYIPFMTGGQITLRSDNAENLDLKTTKYIFVSWGINNGPNLLYADGQWCKVVNATEVELSTNTNLNPNTAYKRTVFITPGLNFTVPTGTAMSTTLSTLIIPGVIYHKKLEGRSAVKIK